MSSTIDTKGNLDRSTRSVSSESPMMKVTTSDAVDKAPRAKTSLLEWVAFAIMIMIIITFPIIGGRLAGVQVGVWLGVLAIIPGIWAVSSFVDWVEI